MSKSISVTMATGAVLAGLLWMSSSAEESAAAKTSAESQSHTVDFRRIPFATIDGDTTNLVAFDGKVVLIVNVASECGNTPQYAGLEELYRKFKDSGLVVIGFPANDFGGQEPGSNEQILRFCTSTYSVTFPMMAKVAVKGSDKHPLFKAMTEKSSLAGEIRWNFSKFLIDRKGNLVARFDPLVKPNADELQGAIRKVL